MTDKNTGQAPIRLALLGAGIFTRDTHLPALLALGDTFRIVAVFSRTRENAARLAQRLPYPVQAYDIFPSLLARDDIDAVDIILPILALPGAVEAALAAGKHVISEKPMAPNVATGRKLLETYGRYRQQVWMVAENLRYEPAFVQAAEMVRSGEIGPLVACHWALESSMDASVKYYHTAWRRDGTLPGGLLLDGGIHQLAALRMVLGDVAAVSAEFTQVRADLPPVDTMSATLRFANGALGNFQLTYAAGERSPHVLHIVGKKGVLRVRQSEVELTRNGDTRRLTFPATDSVRAELAGFAAAVRQGQPHRSSPHECLKDVALFEAMLRSSQTGRREAPEQWPLFE